VVENEPGMAYLVYNTESDTIINLHATMFSLNTFRFNDIAIYLSADYRHTLINFRNIISDLDDARLSLSLHCHLHNETTLVILVFGSDTGKRQQRLVGKISLRHWSPDKLKRVFLFTDKIRALHLDDSASDGGNTVLMRPLPITADGTDDRRGVIVYPDDHREEVKIGVTTHWTMPQAYEFMIHKGLLVVRIFATKMDGSFAHVGVGGTGPPHARNLTCGGGLVPPRPTSLACRYRQLVPPPKSCSRPRMVICKQ